MKFEEVLPALRAGKKIRLKEWEEIEYIYKPEDENELRSEDHHVINLSWKDFFSDDWEIVKEPKKVKLRDLTIQQYDKWIKNNCPKYSYYCNGCPFQKVRCDNDQNKKDWRIGNKDLYSGKFLDQEIEVEEDD